MLDQQIGSQNVRPLFMDRRAQIELSDDEIDCRLAAEHCKGDGWKEGDSLTMAILDRVGRSK